MRIFHHQLPHRQWGSLLICRVDSALGRGEYARFVWPLNLHSVEQTKRHGNQKYHSDIHTFRIQTCAFHTKQQCLKDRRRQALVASPHSRIRNLMLERFSLRFLRTRMIWRPNWPLPMNEKVSKIAIWNCSLLSLNLLLPRTQSRWGLCFHRFSIWSYRWYWEGTIGENRRYLASPKWANDT